MNTGSILSLCLLLLAPGLLGGCASNPSSPAAGDPATEKKGHWVTLPPQTGSYISQRVWVDDSGQSSASPSINNVRNGTAADVQRMQNSSSSLRPPGN